MNNEEDKGYTIYCSRCGAEMNSKSRYCMKCGNLNSDHEANESMKPYIKDNAESYQVGSGGYISGDTVQLGVGNNTGDRKFCFIINFGIYMIIMIISILIALLQTNMDILAMKSSFISYVAVVVSLVFLYMYSIELIFIKCNRPWWSGLIPIYNFMVLSDILYKKKMLGLITLIPVIGQIYMIIMIYTLGKRFKFNGLLTVILSFIFIPIMGFGTSLYMGKNYSGQLEQKEIEKNYQRKKVFLFFIILFFLAGIGLLVWDNIDSVNGGVEGIEREYYVSAAKRIVKKTKEKIKSNSFSCEDNDYYKEKGIYYFKYSDLGDYIYLPFYYQREPIEGYVKVDNTSGNSKYYVSLTDGTTGIDNVLIDNISADDVTNYSKLENIDNTSNVCYVK